MISNSRCSTPRRWNGEKRIIDKLKVKLEGYVIGIRC